MSIVQIVADILFFAVFTELAIALTVYLLITVRDIMRTTAKKKTPEQ